MAEVAQLAEVLKGVMAWLEKRDGEGASVGGEGGGHKKEILYGKGFEMMDSFDGGEGEWNEWSGNFRTMIQTKSEMAGEAMIDVKSVGMTEKDVLDRVEVVRSIKDAADDFEQDEVVERFKDLGKVSKELYRWLRLKTEGEAKLVALAEENEGVGGTTSEVQHQLPLGGGLLGALPEAIKQNYENNLDPLEGSQQTRK